MSKLRNKLPDEHKDKKPIILSKQRYNKLKEHVEESEVKMAQERARELAKYREYLKEGAIDLIGKFIGNIKRSQDEKLKQMKLEMEIRNQKVKESYAASKNYEEKLRQDQLAKAKAILEKLKPGPRDLHRAALECETLRARIEHQKICEDFQKAVRTQDCLDINCEQGRAGAALLEETPERIEEHQQRQGLFKEDLIAMVENRSKQRIAEKDKKLKEELAERDRIDKEIKEQKEKERFLKKQKQNQCRTNFKESIKYKEERLLREQMADELDDRLCCVFNTGKRQLDKLRMENDKKLKCQVVQTRAANTKIVADILTEAAKRREQRICNESHCKWLTFPPEDKDPEEIEQKKQASKQDLLKAHETALKRKQNERLRSEELIRFEMAKRIKNNEINCMLAEEKKQKQKIKGKELLESLLQQRREHKCFQAVAELDKVDVKDTRLEKDDVFFFTYALELMEDAQKKGRPLFPFAKAVDAYKRKNEINCSFKTPKHLASQIELNDGTAMKPKISSKDVCEEEKSAQEIITEKCKKIEQLLALESTKTKDCKQQCPMDCFKHETRPVRGNGLQDCLSVKNVTDVCKESQHSKQKVV